MINVEKAFELANKIEEDGMFEIDALIEMSEWEKQQLIDRLEDWLENNICNAYNFRGDNISSTFINDCIKAMKGEQEL